MPIDIKDFWGSNYYNHPPLTDEMISIAENLLSVSLPLDLIALLRIQNGGYTKGFAYPMNQPTSWAQDHIPLPDLAGIVTDPQLRTAQNLLQSEYLSKEWDLPPDQILLSGDGHYWVTLDYRNGPIPSVAWIDSDCGEDFQIAASFKDFLSGLQPQSRFEPSA